MANGIHDVIVERLVPLESARRICVDLLGLPVHLNEELAAMESLPEAYVFLEYLAVPEDGATRISCSSTNDHPGLPEWRFAALLARTLSARCWTADDGGLPSRYLLADADGRVRPAHVEDDDDGSGSLRFRLQRYCGDHPHCASEPLCRDSLYPPGSVLTAGAPAPVRAARGPGTRPEDSAAASAGSGPAAPWCTRRSS
jgi:hypothetical protein